MKFFAFMLAILVLAQSMLPCADKYAINAGKEKTEITKSTNNPNDQQDHCTPFCHCSCCASFSINHFIASITILPQACSNPADSFLPSAVREVVLPIAQPPQLV